MLEIEGGKSCVDQAQIGVTNLSDGKPVCVRCAISRSCDGDVDKLLRWRCWGYCACGSTLCSKLTNGPMERKGVPGVITAISSDLVMF